MFDSIRTILVIDWPTREVPETLARCGLEVVVRGGANPEDHSLYELTGDDVIVRPFGQAPQNADLVYSYRPLAELPGVVATATQLGAKSIWTQSGFSADGVKDQKGCWLPAEDERAARKLVEAAGMNYFCKPFIVDVVRDLCRGDSG